MDENGKHKISKCLDEDTKKSQQSESAKSSAEIIASSSVEEKEKDNKHAGKVPLSSLFIDLEGSHTGTTETDILQLCDDEEAKQFFESITDYETLSQEGVSFKELAQVLRRSKKPVASANGTQQGQSQPMAKCTADETRYNDAFRQMWGAGKEKTQGSDTIGRLQSKQLKQVATGLTQGSKLKLRSCYSDSHVALRFLKDKDVKAIKTSKSSPSMFADLMNQTFSQMGHDKNTKQRSHVTVSSSEPNEKETITFEKSMSSVKHNQDLNHFSAESSDVQDPKEIISYDSWSSVTKNIATPCNDLCVINRNRYVKDTLDRDNTDTLSETKSDDSIITVKSFAQNAQKKFGDEKNLNLVQRGEESDVARTYPYFNIQQDSTDVSRSHSSASGAVSTEAVFDSVENYVVSATSEDTMTGLQVTPNYVLEPTEFKIPKQKVAPTPYQYHTINIEAISTPPSDARHHRYSRLNRIWQIVKDFFTSLFVCLSVNRDCLFCLGFLVVFIISASFLTAFFYRTLNIGGGHVQHIENKHVMLEDGTFLTL